MNVPEVQRADGPGKLALFLTARARAWPSRVRRGYWIGAAVLALVAIAVVAWCSVETTGTVQYITVPVSRGAVIRAVTATGTVNPELTIIVGSYVSGVIQELYCDYNTQVKQGQVCAKIDPRPYETVANQAKANLSVGKAQLLKDQASLAYAKINYERNRQLAQKNAVSQDVADNARNVYKQAEAQIIDPDSVPDRIRSQEDGGRHQCQ